MPHEDWCGRPCAECDGCRLDERMPCSPDCDALLPDGTRLLAECRGCDAVIEYKE